MHLEVISGTTPGKCNKTDLRAPRSQNGHIFAYRISQLTALSVISTSPTKEARKIHGYMLSGVMQPTRELHKDMD